MRLSDITGWFFQASLSYDPNVEHTSESPQYTSLKNLVNSNRNKQIFSELQFSDNAFFDFSTNTVGTLDFVQHHSYQRQPYVANGYFGARIPSLGHGFAYDSLSDSSSADAEELSNGWPLFDHRFSGAFVAGFYDSQENTEGSNFPWLYQYGWDSVISAIPQWTYLAVSSGNYTLDPQRSSMTWGQITNYVQNLSLENGVVTTQYHWLQDIKIQYDVSANKDNINLGLVNLTIENCGNQSIELSIKDALDFSTAQRCSLSSSDASENGILMVVQPSGVNDVFGSIYSRLIIDESKIDSQNVQSNDTLVENEVYITLHPNEKINISKLVGIATTDLNPESLSSSTDVLSKAIEVTESTELETYNVDHNNAWNKSLGTALEINFPDSPLLTMVAKASVYHMHANMREGASGLTSALGVSGLSSDSYAGQVFWDTDLWMSMGILPFNPRISKSLLNYRLHLHNQATANIDSPSRPKDSFEGAIYPWTSGRFGNCTATGPCFDYEYHLNAAIAYSAFKLYLSGAVDDSYLETVIYPLVYDAALLFATYAEFNETNSKYTTKNLTDPDEFANHIDNGAYTNAAISATLGFAILIGEHLGKPIASKFREMQGELYVPLSADDHDIVLEYSGMNSSVEVKQADVIMMTYPFENELISVEQAIKNLEFYASKQVSTGPAMTFPIFSIVSSKMLDTGCSDESYLLKAVQPYLRGPFAQFSEQSNDDYETNGGTHPAFPFLTAHGGFLQSILMGLLGLRFTFESEDQRIKRVLEFDAKKLSLLPNGVSFGGITYLNYTLSVSLNNSLLSIQNMGLLEHHNSSVSEFKVVFNSSFGETQSQILNASGSIQFEVPSRKAADGESLTECGLAVFTNITSGVYGDVTESMHDGNNRTHWQSAENGTTKILIDLKENKTISSGFINWGDTPATYLKVYAYSNETKHIGEENMPFYFLSHVDFGSDIYHRYSFYNAGGKIVPQDEVFEEVYSTSIDISAPFSLDDSSSVKLTDRYNTSSFELSQEINTQFMLLEFSGVHEGLSDGAKIYDVRFY